MKPSSPPRPGPAVSTRDHYAALDGLRGIAAVSVLLYHIGHWFAQPWLATNAGLAVDFFFCLSGYVLSLAYRKRLDQGMSTWAFLRVRLVRLMPMIVLATLVSGAYLAARLVLGEAIQPTALIGAVVLGLLCLPDFTASKAVGGPQVFPLNGPQYTLFLELVVNVAWAATRRFETLWSALAVTLACFAVTAVVGLGGDTGATFWTGFPRVFGAYYAGVAVFHAQRRWSVSTWPGMAPAFWVLVLVTAALFFWPAPAGRWIAWGWALVVAPLLVLTGSRVRLSGRLQRGALLSGALSYPIYALHYPIFVWVNGVYQQLLHRRDVAPEAALIVPAVLLGSYILLKLVDEPVRAALDARARTLRSLSR